MENCSILDILGQWYKFKDKLGTPLTLHDSCEELFFCGTCSPIVLKDPHPVLSKCQVHISAPRLPQLHTPSTDRTPKCRIPMQDQETSSFTNSYKMLPTLISLGCWDHINLASSSCICELDISNRKWFSGSLVPSDRHLILWPLFFFVVPILLHFPARSKYGPLVWSTRKDPTYGPPSSTRCPIHLVCLFWS